MDNSIMFELIIRISIMLLIGISWTFINLVLKVNTREKAYIKRIYNSLFFLCVLVGVVFMFASFMNLACFFVILGIVFLIWFVFKLASRAITKNALDAQDKGEIYTRDIEANYSPAVLSYLMNQNLEIKKDVMATIINMCAKHVLKIDKDGIKTINKANITQNLTEDEQYIYNCIIKKEKFDKSKWYKVVVDKFNSLEFTDATRELSDKAWALIIFVLTIILLLASSLLGVEMVMSVFMAELVIMSFVVYKYADKQSRRPYTKKGVVEVLKWKKFKAFLKDFSLINEANPNRVILLEKYLSYGMALNINKKYSTKIMKELNINLNINIIDKIKEAFFNVEISE